MRILLLTNEYPPYIYGGAGVHIEYLSRELAKLADVEVRTFHDQDQPEAQPKVRGTRYDTSAFSGCPKEFVSPLKALGTCLVFNGQGVQADVVHCHTWYTQFGGILAKMLYQIPFVLTVHSLEPLRPWKRDQLGNGYQLSSWVERTAIEMADAVIAVSNSTRDDVIRLFNVDPNKVPVIPNGIDTEEYQPRQAPEVLRKYGIDPERPYCLFVGRVTRQKGVLYLLQSVPAIDPRMQIVLAAGESDTPEMQKDFEAQVQALQAERPGVVFIPQMLGLETKVVLYSHAAVFCCPSIYEPFGIINLEAMACGTPVVGSALGGIKEVVIDGETGFLVDAGIDPQPPHDPLDGGAFAARLAEAINRFVDNADLAAEMGRKGRQRVIDHYSWSSVAQQTLDLYKSLAGKS
ncbi:MAG: glycogen synthase [Alphaproteobacteria bacterium]|jgi:glycogen synthase|nr:glycogen synthase [Alphaproteobacteria bacterium]